MRRKPLIGLLALTLLLAPVGPSGVANALTETADTNITVGSHTLKIMKGSSYESLSVDNATGTLTVTVPEGEGFDLRYPGPFPNGLENGGYANTCNVLITRDNQLFIYGPRTVTVMPNDSRCDTANSGDDDTPIVSFSVPNGTEALDAGDVLQLFWSNSGRVVPSIRIRLSTDSGSSFTETVVDSVSNNGFYSWTVPELNSDTAAMLKIEAFDGGRMQAFSLSPTFTVFGTGVEEVPEVPEVPEEPAAAGFDPAEETATAATIGADKGLVEADLPSGTTTCLPNSRIKPASSNAVYYCGVDGKRYVFPNQKTHDTWYTSFAGIIELSDSEIAAIPLGGNVTYRPGVRLVKIQTDPKVYAVAAGGTLRWVTSEAIATELYGSDWNQKVDDVPDAFFVNYTVGEPIE